MTMISQNQSQKQQLKILPQQIQLLNLFFLNNMELEQRINNELDENPLLETKEEKQKEETQKTEDDQDFRDWEEFKYDDVPNYKSEYQNYFGHEDIPEIPIGNKIHYKDDAKQQLRLMKLSDEIHDAAAYIIDVLN